MEKRYLTRSLGGIGKRIRSTETQSVAFLQGIGCEVVIRICATYSCYVFFIRMRTLFLLFRVCGGEEMMFYS